MVQGCNFTWKVEKNGKTWNLRNFEKNLKLWTKNLEFLKIFTCYLMFFYLKKLKKCSVVKFSFETVNLSCKHFCHHQKISFLKTHLKNFSVSYVLILFNRVSYIKLNFNLKVDPKCVFLKTWKKFGKPRIILKKQVATLIFIK